MSNAKSFVCFGEILWDIFPDREVIGGAPFNVAMRLHALGAHSRIISSLGNDSKGEKAIDYVKENDFPTDGIQVHQTLSTGEVLVHLDENRNASYSIVHPTAWDAIKVTPSTTELVKNTSLFIFGSLAARSETSKNTLFELLSYAPYKIFDVNLRAPHYTHELLGDLLKKADFVKLNDEELIEIMNHLGFKDQSLKDHAQQLKAEFSLDIVCVTKGAEGAFLITENEVCEHVGFAIDVVDTVGAGDSFLGCLLFELFEKQSTAQLALERACAMGALVASKEGANCEVSKDELEVFINE